nr:helix-turn-helix domain-containing protein [uncultured Cohaesibacter sp.]
MDGPDEEIFISEFPDEPSIETARNFLNLLASEADTQPEIALIATNESGDKEEYPLSPATQQAIIDMFRLIADGKQFQINSVDEELTVEQAAEILRIPEQHMEKLLNEGRIPFIETEGQRTLKKAAVLAYKDERQLKRSEGVKRLIEMDAELLDIEDEYFKNTSSYGSADG